MKYPPEPLLPEEVRRLIRSCSRWAPTGIRNAALICLLYRTGLRIGEALALYPKDVDLQRGTLYVLHGKGDKARVVGLDDTAAAMVQRWLDCRKFNGRHRLFCTLDGKPLQAQYVRAMMKRKGRRAGIEKRVHAHGLRHSHAAELANEGIPIHVIQQQLGHANVAVTSRYINHLAPTAVIEAIRARQWEI